MIFGLRYTWVTADPFTITILKPWELKNFKWFFGFEVHALCNWSLHDHHPKNHENWKIPNDFRIEVHAGDSWSLHDHQPENHEKWKTSDRFWVEVHAGDSWSFHDHHHKYHEKWNISDDFWFVVTRGWTADPFTITILKTIKRWKNFSNFLGWGTRGVQLIPSRSPA